MKSRISEKKKFEAEKAIEWLSNINQLVRDRANAADIAEQNKLDRELQWKIASHKALRGIFEGSEIPMLDQVWKGFIDSFDTISNIDLSTEEGRAEAAGLISKFNQKWNNFWDKISGRDKLREHIK